MNKTTVQISRCARCAWSALIALALILLTGCGGTAERRAITDVNDLHGVRVGVNLAWEPDYLLTGRRDLELYRFDSVADMLMALNSGKLDAIAVDAASIAVILSQIDGIEVVEPSLGESGYVFYFSPEAEELLREFNSFVAEWTSSSDYKDYLRRQAAFDGMNYPGVDLPAEESGKTIQVAYNIVAFPWSFQDAVTGEPDGFDVEILRRWAAERGYQLAFTGTDYTNMVMGTVEGRYQLCLGAISDLFREDALASGLLVSDSFGEISIYLCQKAGETIHMEGYNYD